ncbi:Putative uncharacterized protein [Taphrina deformans PYCC 5710]|uniref:Asl1-like glycosyl hydrolase catalytic domain-containing protein n=1 Tax=Taphrina deformans (strain PYCC 5710 / ATCC 11124 / CBS 356.35 / IMI 108563 / JCM 9778 / NBRC 8474) TaxID=1097556 RepID=R4X974_TAPDE|nr:Putative uncharacterized protein [Taphrina deformans PYCC 5710]|eukprot:CCG81975.1 Putative uncharacterized protein [Taphrina deformans PYCC 5710]
MQSFVLNSLALVALTNAMPSAHRHGHSHARRGNYDLSNVDWSAMDWAAIFGKGNAAAAASSPAAVAPAAAAPVAAAPTTTAPVANRAAETTTAAASAPTTVSTVSGGKRGLAWDQANDPSLANLYENGKLSWVYNWGASSSFSNSLQFVPMIKTLGDVGQLASVPKGATVLGFNEPDQDGISAGAAAAAYKASFTPLRKSGAIGTLLSPGITNGGAGLPWLQSFMSQCADCEIDALAVHFYGPTMAMFQSQMAAIHAAFPDKQLWITEIGCTNWNTATNPSPAEVSQFMSDAIAWLESTSYVSKYSFFGAMPINDQSLGVANEMMNGAAAGSSLTDLGRKYMS